MDQQLVSRRAVVTVDTIKIEGLRVTFRVQKSLKDEPNTCELSIWNLSENHRAQLEELRPKEKKATKGIPCKIEIGRGEQLQQIWLGDLRTVQSTREGPDWITELSSGDGEKAWQNARINVPFGPRTDLTTVLRAIARALGVGEGNVAKVAHDLKMAGVGRLLPHGMVLSGQASEELRNFAQSADLEVSVQDGALQVLDRGKALAGSAFKLNSASGLIGSPTVDNEGILECTMLITSDVRAGSLLVMDAARVKGNYRIRKLVWDGDSEGGPWYIQAEAERY